MPPRPIPCRIKLTATFLSANGNYFIQNNGGNTNYNYWPQAHTMDALTDAYLRTKNEVYKQRMKSLLNGTRKVSNGNKLQNEYYDDMEWLALSTLRAYEATMMLIILQQPALCGRILKPVLIQTRVVV
jgi:predicted alpha-1,6-mannanase (GH76 family)